MKILFLARRFSPDVGGVEKHVYEISQVLLKKGHKVTVVTQSQGESDEIDGIKIIRIPQTSKNSSEKIHIWKWMLKNYRIIKDSNVVHIHDVYFWYFPTRILFLSKKSFITFHGYETYPIMRKAIVVRKISELLSDGNIIVGEFMKKWYKSKPDFVIYGGTRIPKYKKPANLKSALFFGRLDEHTGIMDYAKAIDLIREKIPGFKFEIVGDGPYLSKLFNYKPQGFKSDTQAYISRNNFAFVSRYLSILEALAQKRLVFALYDNPVKEDYLKMAPFKPFIITSDSPKRLSDKVLYYINNPKSAKKFEAQGYEWVKNQTWESIAKVYLDLWKK